MKTLILLGILVAVALARPADEREPKSFASAGSYAYTDDKGNVKQVSYESDGTNFKITSMNVTPEEEKVIIEKLKNQMNFIPFIPNFGFPFFHGKNSDDKDVAPFLSDNHDDANMHTLDLQPHDGHKEEAHVVNEHEKAPYLSTELESKSSEAAAVAQVEMAAKEQQSQVESVNSEGTIDITQVNQVVSDSSTQAIIIQDEVVPELSLEPMTEQKQEVSDMLNLDPLDTTTKQAQLTSDVSNPATIETITQANPVVVSEAAVQVVTEQVLSDVTTGVIIDKQPQQGPTVTDVNNEFLIGNTPSTEVDINIDVFKQPIDNIDTAIPNNPYPPAQYESIVTKAISQNRVVREIVEDIPPIYVVGEEPGVYAMKIQHQTIFNIIKDLISKK